jgi:endonuclease VIII-like 1
MPEIAEYKISADFINLNSKNKFIRAFHVQKGNIPVPFEPQLENFTIEARSYGKDLILDIDSKFPIHVFMGMMGNWKYVPTKDWNITKYIRLRFDDETGHSLILYGGYMGPKYSVGGSFKGTKRGYDPTLDFDKFKQIILDNLDKKLFDKPICEVLLNQEYFSGVGNYIRSTILYYADVNPFLSGRLAIQTYPQILDLCKSVPETAYSFNGGQLMTWQNPIETNSEKFDEWVYYQKGLSCKDKLGRTFWFNPKWEKECPYTINKPKKVSKI